MPLRGGGAGYFFLNCLQGFTFFVIRVKLPGFHG